MKVAFTSFLITLGLIFSYLLTKAADQKSCPSFEKLSEKEKKFELSYQTLEKFCQNWFFYDNEFAPPAKTLSPKNHQTYQNHLAKNQCTQAEQILWQAYKKKYPNAPEITFSQKLKVSRTGWKFGPLTKHAPETLLCLIKQNLANSQHTIRTKQLSTTPIKDLRKIWYLKPLSQIERIRKQALIHLYTLMRYDYPPAQIFVIQTSLQGEIFQLKPAPLYLLLKRLQNKQQLPENLQSLLIETSQKLTIEEKEKMDQLAIRKRIFLTTNFPTVQQ